MEITAVEYRAQCIYNARIITAECGLYIYMYVGVPELSTLFVTCMHTNLLA